MLDGKCGIYLRESLRGWEGEGPGVICKTVPFDNGSLDQLQTPLLFKQDLSISYWWFMASFSEFI
jgi:hypothetical protein